MKKTIKKLAALLLAGALAATMALPAFATDGDAADASATQGTGRTHTIDSPGNASVSEHSYEAYQILKAGSILNGVYGNIAWADGVSDDAKTALLGVGPYADVKELIEGIQGNDSAKAVDLADTAYKNKSGLGTSVAVENGKTKLGLGLWVIVDTSDPEKVDVVNWANLYASDGTTPVTIVSKVDTTSSEKKVQDINDSDDSPALSELQDSADYDIGDEIPYTITATLPANYTDYDSYYLVFKDDMSKGLTYKQDSAKIQYGNETAVAYSDPTEGTTTYTNGGHMWQWVISNLKEAAPNLGNGDKVIITYKAVLNGDAVVGKPGNPNKMRIEYSNNPNNTGDGNTHETPDDTNIVFTYKTTFNKVDQDNKPLTGADFKLEKKVNGSWVDVTTIGTDAHPTKTGDDTGSEFTFSGLDDGDYKLTETKTPDGYNTIEPIEFTITATHEITSDNPQLTGLQGTGGAEFIMTSTVDEGKLSKDIQNNKGTTLPSTGGMGTTIFYVIGGILVLAAAIILISKRRVQQ